MMERRKNLNDKFGFVEIMEYTSIGESCSVVSGGTPSRSKNEYWENGNIPWIKIGNIKSKYVNEYDELITEQGLNNSSAKLLKKGTILYTIFATLGEVGILDIEACTNQAIAGINIIDSRITTDYLYYYLKSKKDYVNNIGRGVAQNNINLTTLKNFEIPLIDVDKQSNIVEILEKVERMICLKEKEIDDLDLLIKARFVEMFGDYLKDDRRPLSEVAIITGGLTKNSNRNTFETKMPYLRVANVFYNRLDLREILKIGVKEEEIEKTLLQVGDLLFVEGNGSIEQIGRVAIWDGSIDPILHQNHLIKARFNNDIIAPEYALFYFMLQDGRQQIISKSVSTSGLNTLSVNKVSSLLLPIPPIALQNQFANFVRQVDKSREAVKKSLEKTQQLYDSLMQEYFG